MKAIKHQYKILLLVCLLIFPSLILAEKEKRKDNPVRVSRGWSFIVVTSKAPYPMDIKDETQARNLSQEAAITNARAALLTNILTIKAKSGRPLSVAEVPSLDIQKEIRDLVNEAPIKKTKFEKETCFIVLEFDKGKLKKILHNN